MTSYNKTASLAGLTAPVFSKAVGTVFLYQNNHGDANPEYAVAKVAARFRLRVETARLICTLSGIGGGR